MNMFVIVIIIIVAIISMIGMGVRSGVMDLSGCGIGRLAGSGGRRSSGLVLYIILLLRRDPSGFWSRDFGACVRARVHLGGILGGLFVDGIPLLRWDDTVNRPNTIRSAGGCRYTPSSRQSFPYSRRNPTLVLHHWELLVHLIHGH